MTAVACVEAQIRAANRQQG
jgi:hypothetical protein